MTEQVDTRFEQSLVSRAVWPWMDAKRGSEEAPPCRRRALIQFVCMLVIAGLLALKYKHAAVTVSCVALYVIITGMLIPRAFLATERFFKAFGHWVGIALTWLLLVPFFALVFVPGRLLLLLTHKDPLTRSFPGPEDSSWQPHRVREDKSHYGKQYK